MSGHETASGSPESPPAHDIGSSAEDRDLVRQSVAGLAREHCPPEEVVAAEGSWLPKLWQALVDSGMATVSLPESLGGSGGDLHDAAIVVAEVSRRAGPVPVMETTFLACWLHGLAQVPMASGPHAVALLEPSGGVEVTEDGDGLRLRGSADRVAWAGICEQLLLVATVAGRTVLARVDPSTCKITPGRSLAGEPRDRVGFDDLNVPAASCWTLDVEMDAVRRRGALGRVIQMTAALESVLEISVRYAGEREQFGRPIARFQSVRQLLAQLAGETGIAVAACHGALLDAGSTDAEFAIAAAKTRVSGAASKGAALAHQVLGAIGMTREHELHLHTRRLWSWREEYGNETWWSRRVADQVRDAGADGLWTLVAGA